MRYKPEFTVAGARRTMRPAMMLFRTEVSQVDENKILAFYMKN